MARFYGVVGFCETQEEPPESGIWKPITTERKLSGDIENLTRRSDSSSSVNDDVKIDCAVNVLTDDYTREHMGSIKYVELYGTLWKVTSIVPELPRLRLNLGGVYHGEQPE